MPVPRPPCAERLTSRQVTALAAVVAGARSVREVRDIVGWSSENSAWNALVALRAAGWVAWEDGKAGTLRPLVRRVPFTSTIPDEPLTTIRLGAMHTPLVLARADIIGTDGVTYAGVAIRVLDGEVHLADRAGTDLGGRTGIASVAPSHPGWAVTFENGDVWQVDRGGCGCGGSV
jgi:hypothetical protein